MSNERAATFCCFLQEVLRLGVIAVGIAVTLPLQLYPQDHGQLYSLPATDQAYAKLPRIRDSEMRSTPWVKHDMLDESALEGIGSEYRVFAAAYVTQVLKSIRATIPTRKRFRDEGGPLGPGFPNRVTAIEDGEVPIAIVLFPRPNAVRNWIRSPAGRELCCIDIADAFSVGRSVYGRTLVFVPGVASRNPTAEVAAPHETSVSPGMFAYNGRHLRYGKLVCSPRYDTLLFDVSEPLHLGTADGAKLVAEYLTVPVYIYNSRLRWVNVRSGSTDRRFLSYSLLDGNGGNRNRIEGSPFVRPLKCTVHDVKDGKHDQLLLPTPIGWAPSYKESVKYERGHPYEDWCLDDWFPAQRDACWVIREAEDSEPLRESFLLMPGREESNRPLFLISLFFETEPKELITELAAVFKVSAEETLNSGETMQRLTDLYERVRDFPLDK